MIYSLQMSGATTGKSFNLQFRKESVFKSEELDYLK